MSKPDFVHELGITVLPHHLRRVVDLLMDGSDQYFDMLALKTTPRAASTIALLAAAGPLGVTELASRLGLSHPYIIRVISKLIDYKLVSEKKDPDDNRVRLLALTKAGRTEAKQIADMDEAYQKTFEGLITEIDIDLFEAAIRAKTALEAKTCFERLKENTGVERKK